MNATSLSIITTTDPLAGQLPHLLKALSLLAIEQSSHYEVVIVDDLRQWGSTPAPSKNDFPHLEIRTIQPEKRLGQINAMMLGLLHATSPILLTIDPDMHPCVPEVPAMQALLCDNTLAVHGVRKNRRGTSSFRLFASVILNRLVRKLTGLSIPDLGSPVTLLRKEALEKLSPQPGGKINIKIYGYMKLGERLGCYDILNSATPKGKSHYRFPQLLFLASKIIRDSFYLRKLRCKA